LRPISAAARDARWKPILLSALVVELVLLPWQIWLASTTSTRTRRSASTRSTRPPRHRPSALRGLLDRAFSVHEWPLLLPLFLVALVLALRTRLAVFAGRGGRLDDRPGGIYVVSKLEWSNYLAYSGDRVIDSVLVAPYH